MKKLLIALMLTSSLVNAGEYSSCYTTAYSEGFLNFDTGCKRDDGSYCAFVDNNSRAGIYGSVYVSGNTVTFKSRDWFGDVYKGYTVEIPKKAFRCLKKYR